MEADPSQWCPVNRQEAVVQTEIQKIQFTHKRKTFVQWGWSNTGTSCWERLWSLQSLEKCKRGLDTDLSNLLWVVLLDQGVGPDDLQKCLPAPATLWSCGSVKLHLTNHKLITPLDISFCQMANHHHLLCVLVVIHIACFCMFAVIYIVIILHTLKISRLFLRCHIGL